MRVAQREPRRPPARRVGDRDQLRYPACARALGRAPDQALRHPRRHPGDRLPRLSLRRRALRAARPPRAALDAVAGVRRRLRHDAGDDVRLPGLRGRRGRHDLGHRAAATLGQPAADPAGGAVLGCALLPARLARPAPAPAWHGRAGRARRGQRLRRQPVGDTDRRAGGVLRLGHDVRVLPARRALPRDDRAPEGGAGGRGTGQGPALVRRAHRGLAGRIRRRARADLAAAGGGRAAGSSGRGDPGRRRGGRGARRGQRGAAHRREHAGAQGGR